MTAIDPPDPPYRHLTHRLSDPEHFGIAVSGENESFYSLKGMIEELFRVVGIQNARYLKSTASYLQPGRAADVRASDGTKLGTFGELHPDVADGWKADGRVYVAELCFGAIAKCRDMQKRFAPLPRFPVAERDLAVVVDSDMESESLKRIIESTDAGVIVSDVKLFDTYSGVGVQPGKKSLAFSFALRAEDHTLSDEEIKKAMDAIIESLRKNDAPLRV